MRAVFSDEVRPYKEGTAEVLMTMDVYHIAVITKRLIPGKALDFTIVC